MLDEFLKREITIAMGGEKVWNIYLKSNGDDDGALSCGQVLLLPQPLLPRPLCAMPCACSQVVTSLHRD